MNTRFFLGANTGDGFRSYYAEWARPDDISHYYILKGTPGNGKSGFMRRVAALLAEKGVLCEEILCSADPSSLDGVRFPALGTAIVDGTAPHIVEPRFPLAWDQYVPLTQFVDDKTVRRRAGDVFRLKNELGEHYNGLSRVLTAIRSIRDEQAALVYDEAAMQKLRGRCKGIIHREMRKGGGGKLHKRFLDALTPEGYVTLWDTVRLMAENVYELADQYGHSQVMLTVLLNAALDVGQECYACYEPLHPTRLRHLILPGLRLAFVSTNQKEPYPFGATHKIRANAYVPSHIYKGHKLRLRFLRKTEQALLCDAADLLGTAKHCHDLLEDVYVPAVDFRSLEAFSTAYAEKISMDSGL